MKLIIPFRALIDSYEAYLNFQGHEKRVTQHRLDTLLRSIFRYGDEIGEKDVDRFLSNFKGRTPATRNRYRALLKHIFRWGAERGYIEGPTNLSSLKPERENGARTRRLSKEEEERLVRVMSQDMRDLFYAALDTGLRFGALTQLKFSDFTDGTIIVPAYIQKHRQSQLIPMTNRLKNIVMGRISEDGEDRNGIVFNIRSWRQQWERARKDAGVEGLRWHDLRGEMASRLAENKVEVNIISKLLGHFSLNTTARYLRPRVSQFDDAIAVLNKYDY